MAKGNGPCLFCATPCSSTRGELVFGKSKGTIKEQLEVIVILRDILGVEEGKLNHFRGKLTSENGMQVCGSCGEAVGRCVEAVREIGLLQKRIVSISGGLKEQIHATCMEEGEGKDSTWGQLRLQVLGLEEIQGQEGIGANADNTEDSNSSVLNTTHDHDGQSEHIIEAPENDRSLDFIDEYEETTEAGQDSHGIFQDSSSQVEEKVLFQALIDESPSTSGPIITSTCGSVPPPLLDSSLELQSSNSNSGEEPSADGRRRKARRRKDLTKAETESEAVSKAGSKFPCPSCAKVYAKKGDLERHELTHSQRYVCKSCGRSYAYESNFKRHLTKNVCQRPNKRSMAKVTCKYCSKKFVNIAEHENICCKRNRRARRSVPKAPCKYCGHVFSNRMQHERICSNSKGRGKADDSWKKHIQLKKVNG